MGRVCAGAPLVLVPLVVLVPKLVSPTAVSPAGTCEELQDPLCGDLGYNMTYMPNSLEQSQEEAGRTLDSWTPLLHHNCSKSLRPLLCFTYLPPCIQEVRIDTIMREIRTSEPAQLPACRELCQKVHDDCEAVMRLMGFGWPQTLECDRLPSSRGPVACMAPHSNASTSEVVPVTPSSPPSSPSTSEPPAPSTSEPPAPSTGTADPACRPPAGDDVAREASLQRLLDSIVRRFDRLTQLQEQNLLEQKKLQQDIKLFQQQPTRK